MVDGRLAPHRRIHLRQQGRGHLHKRHTAHIAGGGEAGHVAHHAAAQGEQHGFSVTALCQQGIKNQLQGLPVLDLLAIRESHLMDLREPARQRPTQGGSIEGSNRGVAHDQRSTTTRQTAVGCGITQQATANDDAIAAGAQVNGYFLRDLGHQYSYACSDGKAVHRNPPNHFACSQGIPHGIRPGNDCAEVRPALRMAQGRGSARYRLAEMLGKHRLFGFAPSIGIGGSQLTPPLPHHPACGSAPGGCNG